MCTPARSNLPPCSSYLFRDQLLKTSRYHLLHIHTDRQTDILHNANLFSPRYEEAFLPYEYRQKNGLSRFAPSALPLIMKTLFFPKGQPRKKGFALCASRASLQTAQYLCSGTGSCVTTVDLFLQPPPLKIPHI